MGSKHSSLAPRKPSLRKQFSDFAHSPGEAGVAVTAAVILAGAVCAHSTNAASNGGLAAKSHDVFENLTFGKSGTPEQSYASSQNRESRQSDLDPNHGQGSGVSRGGSSDDGSEEQYSYDQTDVPAGMSTSGGNYNQEVRNSDASIGGAVGKSPSLNARLIGSTLQPGGSKRAERSTPRPSVGFPAPGQPAAETPKAAMPLRPANPTTPVPTTPVPAPGEPGGGMTPTPIPTPDPTMPGDPRDTVEPSDPSSDDTVVPPVDGLPGGAPGSYEPEIPTPGDEDVSGPGGDGGVGGETPGSDDRVGVPQPVEPVPVPVEPLPVEPGVVVPETGETDQEPAAAPLSESSSSPTMPSRRLPSNPNGSVGVVPSAPAVIEASAPTVGGSLVGRKINTPTAGATVTPISSVMPTRQLPAEVVAAPAAGDLLPPSRVAV